MEDDASKQSHTDAKTTVANSHIKAQKKTRADAEQKAAKIGGDAVNNVFGKLTGTRIETKESSYDNVKPDGKVQKRKISRAVEIENIFRTSKDKVGSSKKRKKTKSS